MFVTRFRRFLMFTSLTTLMAIGFASPAFARQPDVQTFHNEGTDHVITSCGNFLAIEKNWVQDIRVTTYFDNEGNPVRVQVHVDFDGTVMNSVTGLSLKDPAHYTAIVDLKTGTETDVGLIYGITVPGKGIAVLDAGKVVFDAEGNITFEAGPHQLLHEGHSIICDALA